MTDEKYTFIEDVREKKKTATGAYHKRTHCGKGGAIRFPSDYKTKKELRAMNGAVKEYRLNDPVGWDEFKAWPDDIKVLYIKSLRKAYNVPDAKIFEMMGVGQSAGAHYLRLRGMSAPARSGRVKRDKDGWYAWVNSVPMADKEEAEEVPVIEEKLEKCDEEVLEQAEKCDESERFACGDFVWFPDGKGMALCKNGKEVQSAIPGWGQMELEGTVAECAKTLRTLLADKRVKLTVAWAVKHEEKACES